MSRSDDQPILLRISRQKNKKFAVTVDGKTVNFGDDRYEHFSNDKLPDKFKNTYPVHNDDKRRESYLARATNIKNKRGQLTVNDPLSPNFWSVRLLW